MDKGKRPDKAQEVLGRLLFNTRSCMTVHIPVLVDEVVHWLEPVPGKTFVDGTLGGGGHALVLARRVAPSGSVLGLDRDPTAIARVEQRLLGEDSGLPLETVNANFSDIPEVLAQHGIEKVDGILLDLGLSSDQLQDHERGFSFNSQGSLDLRFNPAQGKPAWKLIERLSEKHLADLIYEFGEERMSRRVASAIVKQRRHRPIRTSAELAELVRRVVPRSRHHSIDPATRTFQALRIAVNEELKWVRVAMKRLAGNLVIGGRLAIISFHSLEDRIVKHALREDSRLKPLTGKPIRPSEQELANNPRSRSSRLRVAERVATESC